MFSQATAWPRKLLQERRVDDARMCGGTRGPGAVSGTFGSAAAASRKFCTIKSDQPAEQSQAGDDEDREKARWRRSSFSEQLASTGQQ